jgi:cytochrome c-type biogenesis protein CcmH
MTSFLLLLSLLSTPASDPVLEQRVMKLSQQFRCLVCQNETIADSHADLAADLRQQIREQMVAGRSDKQITTFLTDRYGDFVLYRPRVTPKTYALWFSPFVLLAGGLYALYGFLKRWPQSTAEHPLTADEHRRVEKLLQLQNDPDVAVYRDQFAEMESNLRNGTVVREQYESDREDLERRLLELWGQPPQSPNCERRN